MKTLMVLPLLILGACNIKVKNTKLKESMSLRNEVRIAQTIPGMKCDLIDKKTEERSQVFIQIKSPLNGPSIAYLRDISEDDLVSANVEFNTNGITLWDGFDLAAYTTDGSDEIPHSQFSILNSVELRLTETFDGTLYLRDSELDEEGHEWVTINPVADIRNCKDINAVVRK